MTYLKILCFILSLVLLCGCDPKGTKKEKLVEEELIINMYYGDQINLYSYIENLDNYYFEDQKKLEVLTTGNYELFIFYHLKNDETLYKQLVKVHITAINTGHNINTKSINKGNYQIFNDELQAGILENLDYQDNTLVLRNNQTSGTVTTPVYETPLFNTIVGSWNVITGPGNNIELMVKVRVDNTWSKYFTYRTWSTANTNYTVDSQDSIAKLSTDMIDILSGKYADAFQIKVFLRRSNIETASPVLKMFSIALDLKDESTFVCEQDYFKIIEIPKVTQMDEPGIGSVICSPTSTTMVLNSLGINITKGDFARMASDNGSHTIYGNWSYNVAAAAELGVKSYVAKITMEELKEFIATGQAVVVSVKSSPSNPLTGAPMQYTSGHLMVVKGFAIIDGVEYVVVNDPADSDVNKVEHYYRVTELNNTWKGYSYIIYN